MNVLQPRLQRALVKFQYRVLAAVASLLVIGYYVFYAAAGKTVLYGDGLTKLNNARRAFDNPVQAISLAQWGSIWLVGDTALISSLAWINPLYRSGLAGSIWSMLAFVVMVVVIYDLTLQVTNRSATAGVAAVLVAALNINVVYFATTPMTEPIIMAVEVVGAWALVRLGKDASSLKWLLIASMTLGAASLVRYEMWTYTFISVVPMGLALWAGDRRFWYWLTRMAVLYATPLFVMAFWIVGWEWALFGDPLYFSNSRYSAHAIDVVGAGKTFAVGNIHESVRQYILAVRWNIPTAVLLVAILGAAIAIKRLVIDRQWHLLGLAYLAAPVVFFPMSLYFGQNAIDIKPGTLFSLNIRYGTTITPCVAVLVGIAVATSIHLCARHHVAIRRTLAVTILVGLMVIQGQQLRQPDAAAVLHDTAAQESTAMRDYTAWLKQHYDYGRILAESFGPLNGVQYHAGIDLSNYITESYPDLWTSTMRDPSGRVEWVLVRDGDTIDTQLVTTPEFQQNFREVFSNHFGRIYLTIDHESKRNGK